MKNITEKWYGNCKLSECLKINFLGKFRLYNVFILNDGGKVKSASSIYCN